MCLKLIISVCELVAADCKVSASFSSWFCNHWKSRFFTWDRISFEGSLVLIIVMSLVWE